MDTKEAKAQRLMLISKWRTSNRRSLSRERPTTPEIAAEPIKKSTRRISKARECLAPISNESDGTLERLLVDSRKSANNHDKENKTEAVTVDSHASSHVPASEEKVELLISNDIIAIPDDKTKNDVEMKEQTSPLTNEGKKKPSNAPLSIGDAVWAYIAGFPLWPSVITADPEGLYTKTRMLGRSETRVYHVAFFGDNGSRSWVNSNLLFPFKGGVEELMKDKDGFVKHVTSKSKIFKSLQNALKTGRKNWLLAVDEAKEALNFSREQRLAFFMKLVHSKEEELIQRKRKTSINESDEPKIKRRRRSKEGSETERLSIIADDEATPSEVSEPTEETLPVPEVNKKKKNPEMRIEVCEICGSRENRPIPCQKCKTPYHLECIEMQTNAENFLCLNCDPAIAPSCCLCRVSEGDLLQCSLKLCSRRYHRECLNIFHSPTAKQEKLSQFTCPAHYCHTCVADLNELHPPEKKLIRCIDCPTAYHSSEKCLAAGCIQLSVSQMKCFKHVENRAIKKSSKKGKRSALPIHYNVNWCLICSEGGSLICCERCPASFHTHCVGLEREPDGSFLCYECTIGKTVLYGDIVWIKMSSYRWWPGRVFPVNEIPVQHQKYQPKAGEFLVYFYGSDNTAFVHRGQVFLYQDGDQGCKGKSKNKLGDDFKLAIEDVTEAFKKRQMILGEWTAERQAKINVKPPPYNRIRSNKPVGKVRMYDSGSAHSSSLCDCDPKVQKTPCGPDSECLNRMLLFECHPNVCPGGEQCQNQRFQKRQSPPLYPFNTGGKGWGLKSHADIKKGDFVIEYVGEIIDNNEFQHRLKAKQDARDEAYYFLTLDNHRMIDAGPSGNLARFMNHSCQPNCETQKWTVLGDTRIGLFAVVDIPAGIELTFNYQLECAQDVANESNQRQQPCHCGAPNCAGFIGAKPKQLKPEGGNKGKKDKKKKKQKKLEKDKVTDDFCFRCTEGGCLIMCDFKNCSKVYHVECLKLSVPPKGQWNCPWHHCDVCGRKATQFCSICPNSLCATHAAEVELQSHDQLGLLCNEHSSEEIEFYVKRQAEGPESDSASPEPSLSETSSC